MNFLDAHQILHAYVHVLSQPCRPDDAFRRFSELGAAREEILQAYKLFLAHMYAFNTRTQDEFNRLHMCIMTLDYFADDAVVDQINACKKELDTKDAAEGVCRQSSLTLAEERMNALLKEMEAQRIDTAGLERYMARVSKAVEAFRGEFSAIPDEDPQQFKKQLLTINDLCRQVYSLAEIPMEDTDVEYFYPFTLLQYFAVNPKLSKLFEPYRDYIRKNR